MTITPAVIDYAKKEIDMPSIYEKADTVTAQHVLYTKFLEGTKWKGVPKMIFYILLEYAFGPAHEKDSDGDLGYSIQLKTENH